MRNVLTNRMWSALQFLKGRLVNAKVTLIVGLVCMALVWMTASRVLTSTSISASSRQDASQDQAIPAYHDRAPEGTLAAVLDPKEFDQTVVQNAYRLADKLKATIYQQPCYCGCDRSAHYHHTSLLDCYTSKHTNGCWICVRELFYVYEQTNKGWTPAQIRDGIVRGEWKAVDIKKYEKAPPQSDQSTK